MDQNEGQSEYIIPHEDEANECPRPYLRVTVGHGAALLESADPLSGNRVLLPFFKKTEPHIYLALAALLTAMQQDKERQANATQSEPADRSPVPMFSWGTLIVLVAYTTVLLTVLFVKK